MRHHECAEWAGEIPAAGLAKQEVDGLRELIRVRRIEQPGRDRRPNGVHVAPMRTGRRRAPHAPGHF